MENSRRSERSRQALLQAALTVIGRDGPGRLTLDAIARESGISKGGLQHQFRTKEAVLVALLDHQLESLGAFSEAYRAALPPAQPEPSLVTQIATHRAADAKPDSIGFALLAGLAADPSLLAGVQERDVTTVDAIRREAADPDLALLRWLAARGLLLSRLLSLCPLPQDERDRLFDRLLDDRNWAPFRQAPSAALPPVPRRKRPAAT